MICLYQLLFETEVYRMKNTKLSENMTDVSFYSAIYSLWYYKFYIGNGGDRVTDHNNWQVSIKVAHSHTSKSDTGLLYALVVHLWKVM